MSVWRLKLSIGVLALGLAVAQYAKVSEPLPREVIIGKNDQQQKLSDANNKVMQYFTREAQEHLKKSRLYLAHFGPSELLEGDIPKGRALHSGTRLIDERILDTPYLHPILVHENVHVLDDKLIDDDAFLQIYNGMNSNWEIKRRVEVCVVGYNKKKADMTGERLSYFCQLYVIKGLQIPDEMRNVLSPMLAIDKVDEKHRPTLVDLVKK